MDQSYQRNAGKGLIVLSIVAVLFASLDYLDIVVAPLNLGANSWMLIGIVFGVYAIAAKQWRSS